MPPESANTWRMKDLCNHTRIKMISSDLKSVSKRYGRNRRQAIVQDDNNLGEQVESSSSQ